ncbi:hypothetical protein MXZ81_05935 [Streptococcus uberis]|nr:hypothetical protein [Streptococcus uberis]MCK1248893.1 hypothetical protein [Streptococcus uberis]
MPNWCEGVIKIRGNKQQIINYLKDLLEPVNFFGEELKVKVTENDYDLTFESLDEFKNIDNLKEITKDLKAKPAFDRWYLKKNT